MKPRSYGPFPYSPIIDRPRLEWPDGAMGHLARARGGEAIE